MTRWAASVTAESVKKTEPTSPNFPGVPIRKAGLVLLRHAEAKDPEIFCIKVKPKYGGQPDFGLPKGSRKYWYIDPESNRKKYADVRDDATAIAQANRLEPIHRTLLAESHEEAGLSRQSMRDTPVQELGPRRFESRNGKERCDIQWFVLLATDYVQAHMHAKPRDATETAWLKLSEMQALEKAGQMNPAYVRAAEEAIAGFKAQALTPFEIPFGPTRKR